MNLFFFFNKRNKFSWNALLGAAEDLPFFDRLRIELTGNGARLAELLRAAAQNGETSLVCFSFFTPQLWETAELMQSLRRQAGPATLFLAGGPHPSGDPQGTLRLGFDLVARGEGEETFRELLSALHSGQELRRVAGLAWLDESGNLQSSSRRPLLDLDAFPPHSEKTKRFGPIEISRGCPFVCSYCQTPHLHGGRVRHRSLSAILEQVTVLHRHGITDIRFITPNAFSYGSADGRSVDLEALDRLLAGVRQTVGRAGKIFFGSFPSEVRPEQVSPESVALVKKYCHNDNLVFGAQSGSPRMLEMCRRAHTVADVYRAAELCRSAGFKTYVDFIFGLPGEEEEDIRLSLGLMRELAAMGAQVHAHTFMPLPGTAFAGKEAGRVAPEVEQEMQRLTARGRAFGQWRRQQQEAARIASYLRTGSLAG